MARQPVMVQPGFPDRHDLGMPRQFAKCGAQILRRLQHVRRMPARHRKDLLMRLRKRRPDVVSLDAPLDASSDEPAPTRELVDWGPTPEQALSDGETRAAMDEAIAALPPDQRAAFLLRDVEELGNAEAAAALELSVPAFKARVHRARLFLRDRLDRHFGERVRKGG